MDDKEMARQVHLVDLAALHSIARRFDERGRTHAARNIQKTQDSYEEALRMLIQEVVNYTIKHQPHVWNRLVREVGIIEAGEAYETEEEESEASGT